MEVVSREAWYRESVPASIEMEMLGRSKSTNWNKSIGDLV
jgi:hypothetical protein